MTTGGVSRRRKTAFAVVATVSLAGACLYVAHAVQRAQLAAADADGSVAISALPDRSAHPAGYVLYRDTSLGKSNGALGLQYLDDRKGSRFVTPLRCERVYFSGGHGICLAATRGVGTAYFAHVFDRQLAVRATLPLAGPPSRTRVSANGKLAAITVFTSGHSYSNTDFSTRTSLVDAVDGHMLVDNVEQFEVSRGGVPFKAPDFNFWGGTFAADGTRFYATMGTSGKTYLVEGDIARRTFRIVFDDVECPSLSPDGRHVAFKRRVAGAGVGRFSWRLHVLDLGTGKANRLDSELRSIDDQVEWLNDHEIAYSIDSASTGGAATTDVWAVPVDRPGAPRRLLSDAFSPTVVR